ncbi:MAG TPA: 2,3-epoxybenzoyl-CoA dihydrolase [Acidimicrobiia bacterium]|nr:2,3-epoxybenzoyl-CoA dihydrolase [Acidimicrobiia bacterium]
MIDFRTHPDRYKHWKLSITPPIAHLILDVDPDGGLGDYELKLNSYDLAVDIELADAVQRLRFEHPEVGAVLVESGKDRVFCAGANIGMLAQADHGLKVNFCKFTNETRVAMEEATERSKQAYVAAIAGTAAGGGYELALACDRILLIDDGSASVSLPEVPLLGVLPGTGGLTRLTDKRHVLRDRADVLCTTEEGIKGRRALEWNLVDELIPRSRFAAAVEARVTDAAASTDRPSDARGIALTDLERTITGDRIEYSNLTVSIDRPSETASITISGPAGPPPHSSEELVEVGDSFWPLAVGRQLDDALLHLRLNEPEIGTLLFRTSGDLKTVASYDAFLLEHRHHWLAREVVLLLGRTMKRLDMTARSIISLIEDGSCFAGFMTEIPLASDRVYIHLGEDGDGPRIRLTEMNLGDLPMGNGLSRLATRFWGRDEDLSALVEAAGEDLDAKTAVDLGLATFAFDDIDWDDEIRLFLEERSAFSPDALTGMEANLRLAGPETMETKIFGRLTAWQNWVFYRPNASGPEGTLRSYGSGRRPTLDQRRT